MQNAETLTSKAPITDNQDKVDVAVKQVDVSPQPATPQGNGVKLKNDLKLRTKVLKTRKVKMAIVMKQK